MSQIASFRAKLSLLTDYLDDQQVTEIQINRPGELWLRKRDVYYAEQRDVPALTYSLLSSLAEVTASFKSLEVDRAMPILSAEIPVNLEDGIPDFERGTYRTEMILPPVVPERTIAMTIRKQSLVKMTLPMYSQQGAFRFVNGDVDNGPCSDARLLQLYHAGQWAEFLRAAVLARKNIAISAGTYCGKTTCLNALVQEIPAHERIVTIEDAREIEPAQPNCVRLSYARHQAAGQTAVTPATLLRSCMRLTPDRVIMGEVRGPEAVEFLGLLNTGHKGTLTTIHTDSPSEMYDRFGELMDGHTSMTREQVIERVKRRIDVVVQWKYTEREGRYVSEILYAGA
ncbi:P-type DNA transfer ATPase VirB11 [Acidovorax sp. CCYZU-2555]|uniref:P-type DNA transfer ATPase VirB11 n=1 Tax=Acidovorax sp. CCYZU-2555 TaxID=2835042 RepID=UPI001BD13534|nr:P-type DNA transfer ATPase VirB11 [Acidovorax sp. CCYZU-2555]MBS7776858.1 P-type DNA transfer ATPase VirB11 [Acidovorax sp. CCYZU-2555]